MHPTFTRFETFGSIANPAIRKQLSQAIFEQLSGNAQNLSALPDNATENFSTAIQEILKHPTLVELCSQDPDLAEQITQDTLDYIQKAKKRINQTESPYKNEEAMLEKFKATAPSRFQSDWKIVKPKIQQTYKQQTLDTEFYEKEFNNSLEIQPKDAPKKTTFETVREHFTEKWEALIYQKQTQWELDIIAEERKQFCETLYQQIEALKQLQQALEPLTDELGRLWDMSKGKWQRANLATLQKYATLLKRDQSLKDLAELLGKMRQAEKEYEIETFTQIVQQPTWKVDHASKSDIIGVVESDDLSSVLPAELALLADETLQTVFFKKYVEKKLQTFEYQARVQSYKPEMIEKQRQKEKAEQKGPFILCVDTSGSMHGTPEMVAKTLSFAILKISIRENRKCFLISFSTGIETLNLSDLRNSLDRILDFLSMSFHGGTDATPAMQEALRMLQTEDYQKADVILVSDFIMPALDQPTREKVKQAQTRKTRFHSLVIGSNQNKAAIKDFDHHWEYDPQNPKGLGVLVRGLIAGL